MIFGFWTVGVLIICLETDLYLRNLMSLQNER